MKQKSFEKIKWNHRYTHGGTFRKQRAGRGARPLSTKNCIHLVLKANKEKLVGGFRTHRRFKMVHLIMRKYANHFWVQIDQISIQNDHIHVIIRASRRSKYGNFFRVVAGQIAQQFQRHGLLNAAVTDTPQITPGPFLRLWKQRPFTRVIIGHKAYKLVRDYIQLNEKEALGLIRYNRDRLRGPSLVDWDKLWS